jgi:hypothetical protein
VATARPQLRRLGHGDACASVLTRGVVGARREMQLEALRHMLQRNYRWKVCSFRCRCSCRCRLWEWPRGLDSTRQGID